MPTLSFRDLVVPATYFTLKGAEITLNNAVNETLYTTWGRLEASNLLPCLAFTHILSDCTGKVRYRGSHKGCLIFGIQHHIGPEGLAAAPGCESKYGTHNWSTSKPEAPDLRQTITEVLSQLENLPNVQHIHARLTEALSNA